MRPSLLAVLVCALALSMSVSASWAGTLENRDREAYLYELWWDDLSPPDKGTIDPRQKVEFEDKPCTVAVKKASQPERESRDSIYVMDSETAYIQGGVLRK